MMKKITAILLAFGMVMTLCGCKKSETPGNAAPADTSAEVSTVRMEADTSAPAEQAESGVPVVDIQHKTGENTAEDGAVLMAWELDEVTVTIPGNEEAAAAIQSSLDSERKSFEEAVAQSTQNARSFYEDAQSDSSAEIPEYQYSYSDAWNVRVARCDEAVLSLVVDDIGYAGGAHGWDNRYALNYDVKTGKPLTFADLGGDAFVGAVKDAILKQAADMEEADPGLFFEGYADSVDSVIQDGTKTLKELYGEDMPDGTVPATFYLTEDELVFISGEYAMQSYAAGIIEFGIFYADVADTLNAAYAK